jgi:xylulokinase
VCRLLAVDWDTLYTEAFAVAPGAGGVRFLPYLSGERTPHLDAGARGAWTGLGIGHHRGHLLRAALEGVAFALRDCMTALEPTAEDGTDRRLRLAGGGTVVPVWRQLLADVLRRSLAAVDRPDASARGAALLAGVAAGVYPDLPATLALAPPPRPVAEPTAAADVYDEVYEQWRELYPRVRDDRSVRGDGGV